MSPQELQASLLRAAQISKGLTDTLDEYQQDLFEKYCTIYESIVKHECEKKKAYHKPKVLSTWKGLFDDFFICKASPLLY